MEKLAHHRKKGKKKKANRGTGRPGSLVNSKHRYDQKFPPSYEPWVQCVPPHLTGTGGWRGVVVVMGAQDMAL